MDYKFDAVVKGHKLTNGLYKFNVVITPPIESAMYRAIRKNNLRYINELSRLVEERMMFGDCNISHGDENTSEGLELNTVHYWDDNRIPGMSLKEFNDEFIEFMDDVVKLDTFHQLISGHKVECGYDVELVLLPKPIE